MHCGRCRRAVVNSVVDEASGTISMKATFTNLTTCQALALITTPVIYVYLDRLSAWIAAPAS